MFDCQNFSKIVKICQHSQIVNTWIYTSELMRSKWGAGLCECLARVIQGAWEYGDVWVDIRQQFVGMASAGHTGESDSWLSCHPSNGPSPEHHLKFGVRVHPRAWPGANPGWGKTGGMAWCWRSGKSSKARSVSDVAEWQQPAVPIFVPLLLL